jgi:hypothetical protein
MNPIREAVNALPGQWQKGAMGRPNGARCGLGHVSSVLQDGLHLELFNEATDYLTQAAMDKFPERTSRPKPFFPWFNDHEDTTEQDVIQVMNLAADRWDADHEG